MKFSFALVISMLVLAALSSACVAPPSNGRGDDCGPTRGPLSATSKDLDVPLKKGQSPDDVFNPNRW